MKPSKRRLADLSMSMALAFIAACGGTSGAPPAGVDRAPSTPDACALLTDLRTLESETDGDDLASLRAQAPRFADLAALLLETAPSDIEDDARILSDHANDHLVQLQDPSLVLEPDVLYLWGTDESLRAGQALRGWAEGNCAESIDRQALMPEKLSLCLPRGATREDVQALFERTSEPSPTGRGNAHVDGIVGVAAQSRSLYVELDRLITAERREELLASLSAPPVEAVVESGRGCP